MRIEFEGRNYLERLLNWKSSVLDEIQIVQELDKRNQEMRRAAAGMSESFGE